MTDRPGAAQLAAALAERAELVCAHYLSNGRRWGDCWRVGNVHNERGQSLSVRLCGTHRGKWFDGNLKTHGDLLDIVRSFEGSFEAARNAALSLVQLPFEPAPDRNAPDEARNARSAARIFSEGIPLPGTKGEAYLASRGIAAPLSPEALRFHPSLVYRTDEGFTRYPGLVAAVTGPAGEFRAVHRTFLAHNAPAKAQVPIPRLSLGKLRDGAIRFAGDGPITIVGEGIETVLAVKAAFPSFRAVSCISAVRLETFAPAPHDERILVVADYDTAGISGSGALVTRLARQQRAVAIAVARHGDFADDLAATGAEAVRSHLTPIVARLAADPKTRPACLSQPPRAPG